MDEPALTILPDGITVNMADELTDPDFQESIKLIIHPCTANYLKSLETLAWSAIFADAIGVNPTKLKRIGTGNDTEPEGRLLKLLKDAGKKVVPVEVRVAGHKNPQELLSDPAHKRSILALLRKLDAGMPSWQDHMIREVHLYKGRQGWIEDADAKKSVPNEYVDCMSRAVTATFKDGLKMTTEELRSFVIANAVTHVAIYEWYSASGGLIDGPGTVAFYPHVTRAGLGEIDSAQYRSAFLIPSIMFHVVHDAKTPAEVIGNIVKLSRDSAFSILRKALAQSAMTSRGNNDSDKQDALREIEHACLSNRIPWRIGGSLVFRGRRALKQIVHGYGHYSEHPRDYKTDLLRIFPGFDADRIQKTFFPNVIAF